jgi:glycolate oxidase
MTYQFTEADLAQQRRLKCAFDPDELLNPGKAFPTPCRCGEFGRAKDAGKSRPFTDIPAF